jgi:hypothetical protein
MSTHIGLFFSPLFSHSSISFFLASPFLSLSLSLCLYFIFIFSLFLSLTSFIQDLLTLELTESGNGFSRHVAKTLLFYIEVPDFAEWHVTRVTNSIPSTLETVNTLHRSVFVRICATLRSHVRIEPTGLSSFCLLSLALYQPRALNDLCWAVGFSRLHSAQKKEYKNCTARATGGWRSDSAKHPTSRLNSWHSCFVEGRTGI